MTAQIIELQGFRNRLRRPHESPAPSVTTVPGELTRTMRLHLLCSDLRGFAPDALEIVAVPGQIRPAEIFADSHAWIETRLRFSGNDRARAAGPEPMGLCPVGYRAAIVAGRVRQRLEVRLASQAAIRASTALTRQMPTMLRRLVERWYASPNGAESPLPFAVGAHLGVVSREGRMLLHQAKGELHAGIQRDLSSDDLVAGRVDLCACLQRWAAGRLGLASPSMLAAPGRIELVSLVIDQDSGRWLFVGRLDLEGLPGVPDEAALGDALGVVDAEFLPFHDAAVYPHLVRHGAMLTGVTYYAAELTLARSRLATPPWA